MSRPINYIDIAAQRFGGRCERGRFTPPPQGEWVPMLPLFRPILGDDALTRHLGDAEARILIEWLVERAERLADQPGATERVAALCLRGRAIGLFVGLWCHRGEHGAAGQLANVERFAWPLPPADIDACALMERILYAEERNAAAAA